MVSSCYLCNRKASSANNISLHRFPKNSDIRTKWLNACGLTTDDDVRRTCICSLHFRTEYICQTKIFGSVKSAIKRNAVPTLHLTSSRKIDASNKSSKLPLSEQLNENQILSILPDNNIVELDHDYCLAEKSVISNSGIDYIAPDKLIEPNNTKVQISNNSSVNSELVDTSEKSDANRFIDSIGQSETTVADENSLPKRKFFEPRYVSEISPLDFATPERSRRTIHLIKTTDKKKSQKIKELQRQHRNLRKRVRSLQDLINRLKKNRSGALKNTKTKECLDIKSEESSGSNMKIRSKKNPFRCRVCNTVFTMKSHLVQHSRIHMGEKPFKCEDCNKCFRYKSYVIEHARIHTGERPLKCEVCDKCFRYKSSLYEHSRIHTGENLFKCTVCNKLLLTKRSLIQHLRIHTGEKPFNCVVCDKSFTMKSNLHKHLRTHRVKKSFKCGVCDKYFRTKQYAILHLKSHSDERPLKCEICDKSYKQKASLIKHLKIHV